MEGVERLELPDALAITNRVSVKARLVDGYIDSWKAFAGNY